ncbi:MAG: hypothetical protein MSS15_09085, partial [Prevotella sp.]|nr:hypothetical protein [Prevotella sp.]
ERSENESRKKTTSFSSYSIIPKESVFIPKEYVFIPKEPVFILVHHCSSGLTKPFGLNALLAWLSITQPNNFGSSSI